MKHLSDQIDDATDGKLCGFLAAELDGHIGTARARFEAALKADAPRRSMRRWWAGGGVALAAAAGLAVAVWPASVERATPLVAPLTAVAEAGPVRLDERWQTRDLGVYADADGRPVRAVGHRRWQALEYRNAAGAEVRIEQPRDYVVLVDAPVY